MEAHEWARTRQTEQNKKEQAQQIDEFEDVRAIPVAKKTGFLPTHREATLHVRAQPGHADHKITVFLLDGLCCGSSAYWSIKGLLASLGIERSDTCYKAWYQTGLQYQLDELQTNGIDDTTVLKHKPGCTELVMLLLTRWSFCRRVSGGFRFPKIRSACESFLRTLCKALHEHQPIKIPFCLHPVVTRHECRGINGNDAVFISVGQDGIVDLSELRARAESSHVAQLWLQLLDTKFGCEGFDLVDLLRWSVTSECHHIQRNTFHMQVVWNISRTLENFILMTLHVEDVGEANRLRL